MSRLNQDYKRRINEALNEYQNSKVKTEAQIAKEHHISRRTLYKYAKLNNISRKYPIYKSPKKPAKELSKQTKHQLNVKRLKHQIKEYTDKASPEEMINIVDYIMYTRALKLKALNAQWSKTLHKIAKGK